MSDQTTHITGVGTVGIPVDDHDQALAFYVGVLGFEIQMDVDMGGFRWVTVAPPGATTSVALVAGVEGVASGVDTGIRFVTTDADADHAYLRDRGVDVDAEVIRWEVAPPMFTFRDPDGNTLYLVEQP